MTAPHRRLAFRAARQVVADAEVDVPVAVDEPAPPTHVAGTRRAGDGRGRGELGFDQPGGPLVVVCGLHGGAGTSILAHLLAHYSARASRAPVLLCEAPAASGDQRALSDLQSAVSLAELAATLAQGDRPPSGWWAQRDNLRVLATHPQGRVDPAFTGDPADVLRTASGEHGLTILDGATIRDPATRELLPAATHVIWTLNAAPGAAERAQDVFASPLIPALAAAQIVAMRATRRRDPLGPLVRDVRRVAECQQARGLLLLPDAPALAQRPPDLSRAPLQHPLASLTRFLHEPAQR